MWWEALIAPVLKIIDKVVPDVAEAERQKQELVKMALQGELDSVKNDFQLAIGQMEVNKTEAASDSVFKGGWRPFIGWVCGSAFAFNFVVLPLSQAAASAFGHPFVAAPLDMTTMMPVLLGMLGLGGMRSFERIKGKA